MIKNEILLDNVVFYLQKIDGINNYSYNLLKKFVENNNIFYSKNNY